MFTGIIQATATIAALHDHHGLRRLTLAFPPGFCRALAVGASVAVDGVCLTVADIPAPDQARFDVMRQSLDITTLGQVSTGEIVNVERAALEGAEIGGHIISGHVDFMATLLQKVEDEGNCRLRFDIPEAFRRYVFARGYLALNGASLTVCAVERQAGWFEVCLIPETRRVTTFDAKTPGARLNVEIERQTQVLVDTLMEGVRQGLKEVLPQLLADVLPDVRSGAKNNAPAG